MLMVIQLILNDHEKNGNTQSCMIKIYSFKILFTSFHLNNQAVSGRCILSWYCFELAIWFIFEVGEDGDAWYIFPAPFTYICFLMWLSQHGNGNSNPVRFDWYEYYCVKYFWLHKWWIQDFLCMCQYLKRKASPIDQHPVFYYFKVHCAFTVKGFCALFLLLEVLLDW